MGLGEQPKLRPNFLTIPCISFEFLHESYFFLAWELPSGQLVFPTVLNPLVRYARSLAWLVMTYCGWTKSILHHFETMVEASACWYLQENHHFRIS